MNSLVDYFCVIGIDEADVVALIQKDLSRENMLSELKKLSPSIISRYPEHDKERMPLDFSLELSLPNVIFHNDLKTL